eukprot:gene54436-72744_t
MGARPHDGALGGVLCFRAIVSHGGGSTSRAIIDRRLARCQRAVRARPAHSRLTAPRPCPIAPRLLMGTMMQHAQLQTIIETAWEDRAAITFQTKGEVRDAVDHALNLLDRGEVRVAERVPGETGVKSWKTNQWLKKAVLLSFRLNDMSLIPGGPDGASWWDKVPSKFAGWGEAEFRAAGFRAVPNCIVRRSAFVAPGAILMPSFVNLGAYVDTGTMVDTWVTVGSCAQIGKNVHLSGGVGIGGVLEPLQANPTIIGDDCFAGIHSLAPAIEKSY